MDNVFIRKAIPGDEQVLAYIQTESWKAAFAGILSPEELVRCTNQERQSRCTTVFSGVKAVIWRLSL